MDAATQGYCVTIAAAIEKALGSQLVGVYLHGSGVLGGFDGRRSDVDMLDVCERPMAGSEQAAVAAWISRNVRHRAGHHAQLQPAGPAWDGGC